VPTWLINKSIKTEVKNTYPSSTYPRKRKRSDPAVNSNDGFGLSTDSRPELFTLRTLLDKKAKEEQNNSAPVVPVVFARVCVDLTTGTYKDIKALVDSGASSSVVRKNLVKNLRSYTHDSPTRWTTAAGQVRTNHRANVTFMLPEFSDTKTVQWAMHVFQNDINYDIIIGRDLLVEMGMIIDFNEKHIMWNDVAVPMRRSNANIKRDFYIQESEAIKAAEKRIERILDAKYEPADLDKIVEESSHLDDQEKLQLREVLEEYKTLFDGTLGKWTGTPLSIELREGVKPYHARAFPIPKSREATLKTEIERLCKIGVLRKVNDSEWAAPTFIIPKKDGSVRFISDFRELNKRIKRKPYPLPKIQDLLLKLEGFKYGTSLDLNMGYYHIALDSDARKYCTIVLPWGKYEYLRLPMGLCNSPDIFQEKMGNLMSDLEYVRTYIDDLMIFSSSTWEDHLNKLRIVLKRLLDAGLKVNAKKSFFGRNELEYLGYWISREGIRPLPKKVQAILNIKSPSNKKELRRFIGMINFYRDMWRKRSDILSPLATLTSKKTKWQWSETHEKAFQLIKQVISKEVMLVYPNFNEVFHIHTDASKTQLGAVISQYNRPIAFYSRKLNPAQTRYTTGERELLAVVETLKEFKNILFGQKIHVHTDHLNITRNNINIERILRWRLIIEEFNPEFIYIKGEQNTVADALSRLDTINEEITEFEIDDDLPDTAYPLNLKLITKYQQKDEEILKRLQENPKYQLKSFSGGGKVRQLVVKDDKIVIPAAVQRRIVDWYHTYLCHPGETRTEATIRQHFTGISLRETVQDVCKKCKTCQITKRSTKKYGKLPEKTAEDKPWEKLCVDLIGPYRITNKKTRTTLTLWCVTMIDPATGWFEIRELKNKEAINVANIVEQAWLTRYPWPVEITYDKGTEFMGEFAKMIEHDYGIQRRGATVRNPQANAIIERLHQTLGNILRTFQVQDLDLTEENPWNGILSAAMFALRATYHTTLQATPMQLVFGRDAMLNIKFQADWKLISERKQKLIRQNNMRENASRITHDYHIGDKVLYLKTSTSKYGDDTYAGPYTVQRVNNNGTVRLKMGAITDTVNIRLIKPYSE
jgi:transposase InsO family protein